mmetsp:Transcript_20388/g.28446  ORF Transcript_20388/g.28446 Transcript_20388/m.28446 type:complete len:82 (+) Transcript_20388:753-998(+)
MGEKGRSSRRLRHILKPRRQAGARHVQANYANACQSERVPLEPLDLPKLQVAGLHLSKMISPSDLRTRQKEEKNEKFRGWI